MRGDVLLDVGVVQENGFQNLRLFTGAARSSNNKATIHVGEAMNDSFRTGEYFYQSQGSGTLDITVDYAHAGAFDDVVFFNNAGTTRLKPVPKFTFNFHIKKAEAWTFENTGFFGLTTLEYTAEMDMTIDEVVSDSEGSQFIGGAAFNYGSIDKRKGPVKNEKGELNLTLTVPFDIEFKGERDHNDFEFDYSCCTGTDINKVKS